MLVINSEMISAEILQDQNMWRIMYMSNFGGPADTGEYQTRKHVRYMKNSRE
jgi:hypothetical protein